MIEKNYTIKRHRIYCGLVLVVILVYATACASSENNNKLESTNDFEIDDILENPDPEIDFISGMDLDIVDEKEYNNFSFELSTQEFIKNKDNQIVCKIINNNVGNGFYYYQILYIEFKNKGEWQRLAYYPPEIFYEGNWFYSGVEGNNTEPNTAEVYFEKENLKDELYEGQYRLVLFVGPKVFYANFKVT